MDRIKLEILGLSSSQSQSGSFALVLGESNGKRRLPIIIGMFEAQAIAIEIEKIVPNRPMTHDLFKSFAMNFRFEVKEIIISDLKEGVFYARIVCESDDNRIEIDSRPSDAIAIGLRFNAPIYTYETILGEAGIILSEKSEEPTPKASRSRAKKSKDDSDIPATPESLKELNYEKLNEMLDKAIEVEDYERAAKIRDEMNRRN